MKSRAFTLVELLIVVGIMGLLATIGVSAYSTTRSNARNMQRKASLTQAQKALEMYANDHGGLYPSTSGSWASDYAWPNAYIPGFSSYMNPLPHDPNTGTVNKSAPGSCATTPGMNTFSYSSNGTDYKLVVFCTPEGTLSASDPFYDPTRATYAWQVSSPGGRAW